MDREDDYQPEKHVSLDALAEALGDDGPDYAKVEELGRLHDQPRHGARRPTEYERPIALSAEGLEELQQVEKQLRMRRVLDDMDPKQVELLVARYVSQRELTDIADDEGVSYQAIQQRLASAHRGFKVSFARNWNQDIDLDYLYREGGGLDV